MCIRFLLALVGIASQPMQGQLAVQSEIPVAQMVEQIMGPGAHAFNITFNGQPGELAYTPSAGAFQCANCNIGLTSGLALSTGSVYYMAGPNNNASQTSSGVFSDGDLDSDMFTLVSLNGGDEVNDLSVIEFDYIPFNDSIQFEFVWGSEEYNSYVGGMFNDVFGIFISGPGISGPFLNNAINLAVIPGTDIPVSVNTINNGSNLEGPCMHCEFYNQIVTDAVLYDLINSGYDPYMNDAHNVQFDGYTDVISSGINVVCGQTYHVKIAICDATDNGVDSGVFIKGRTLSSEYAAVATLQFNVDGPNDNTVYEQCSEGAVRIHRPAAVSAQAALTCYLDWQGSAAQGIDYNTMPDSVVFNPQQLFVDIPFDAYSDSDVEFLDTVILNMSLPSSCSGSIAVSDFTFYISDVIYPFVVQGYSTSICPGPFMVEPIVSGGFGNYTYQWNTGSTEEMLNVDLTSPVVYTVTVGDTCGLQPITVEISFNVFQFDPVTVSLEDTDGVLPLECGDNLPVYAYGQGGAEYLSYYFFGNNGTWVSSNNNVATLSPWNAGDLYVRAVDACGNLAFDTLNITLNVPPLYVTLPDTINAMCGQEVYIESTVIGGQVASNYWYSWYLDGAYQSSWPPANLNWYFAGNSELVLYASDDCGQGGYDTTHIVMIGYDGTNIVGDSLLAICESLYGCNEVGACNFDTLAIYDDGSCYVPMPLSINGQLDAVSGETNFYWVADYFSGAELLWTIEGGQIISSQDSGCSVLWYEGLGALCVQESVGESCLGNQVCAAVNVAAGLSESAYAHAMRVFPNPVHDELQIVLSHDYSAGFWFLYSIDGRLAKTGSFSGKSFKYDVSDLPVGSYGIKVITADGSQSHGILVKE